MSRQGKVSVILQPDLDAQMAELVDASDSKSGSRKGVQVRFLFWAQIKKSCTPYGIFLWPRPKHALGSGQKKSGERSEQDFFICSSTFWEVFAQRRQSCSFLKGTSGTHAPGWDTTKDQLKEVEMVIARLVEMILCFICFLSALINATQKLHGN